LPLEFEAFRKQTGYVNFYNKEPTSFNSTRSLHKRILSQV